MSADDSSDRVPHDPAPEPEYVEEPVVPQLSGRQRAFAFARGLFRLRIEQSAVRVAIVGAVFLGLFSLISGRLIYLAVMPQEPENIRRFASAASVAARPDIIDRNGEVLATDVRMVSIFAEPRNIIDKDEAVELLTAVLPDLNAADLRNKLNLRRGFVWVKREVTPREQAEVHRLGIPGVGFVPESKRVYPNGVAAAHVLGFANIDNVGIAGIEKYIDSSGLQDLNGFGFARQANDLKPVQLSIDLRIQHAMRDELVKGMAYFRAKAAASMLLDVTTGEIVSLVSLPDFDPNNPVDALEKDRINRMIVGVYEMGSTFKALTTAMVLDSGKANINSTFDARSKLRYGRFSIGDYHGTNRILTVPEVFLHSSNIGTAKMALAVGVEGHKAFLKKMGQLDRMRTEMPESSMPIVPARWGDLNTITIAFGHGIAVAPMQATAAVGALLNGGLMITPTFLKRSAEEARAKAVRVIKPETSEALRYVMRLNAQKGSASKAAVPGYFVGGKTGTAEKVVGGRYSKTKLFTTFMAVTPADSPRYLFVTVYDEPQPTPESHGYATAAWNAGETTGRILERIAPMLSVPPRFDPPKNPFPLMARLGAWGTR
ncbi:peptidoglycan D,D-transpeptidase FtsI family protein [Enterovirga rhinocerotis]|uniref:Cell division protein FtsI (Penicillin-binding protein 3) n=1 Tax=Enterovirga rhinocerotis TaxID=1339210 RepID=A0A4R7BRY1_9HYPH|nr:penicillin-binding protein 2 [Enterovirga rhinocerotis]TDR88151.1 cell division protein FtsI (penicillin-binding protein 3) [Enterovirga rhinocerotis]